MEIKVKLTDGAPMPKYAKAGDAGMDLTSRETVDIAAGETVLVGTGVWMEIPDGYYGAIVPRSSVASKRGITLANTPATIDSGYRGEIMLPLHNMASPLRLVNDGHTTHYEANHDVVRIERGERVAQIIIKRYEQADCIEVGELSETARGDGGFGSTGR